MKETNLNECASVSGASNQAQNSQESSSSSKESISQDSVSYEESAEYNNQTNQDLSLPTFIKVEKVTRYVDAEGELFETHEEAVDSIRKFEAWNDLRAFVNATSWDFQDADLEEYFVKNRKTLTTLLNAIDAVEKTKGE